MIEARNLWTLIQARAEASPDRVLAVDEREREFHFREFRDRALRVAVALSRRGVRPGDRVSWQLPTWIESIVLAGALARLGAVQNPLLPILRRRELEHIIRQVRPRLLVVPGVWRGFDYDAMARPLAAGVGCDLLVCDRALPEEAPGPEALPQENRDPEALRWVLFTSGTTSAAKGAMHSDASIAVGASGVSVSLEVEESDRWAIPFPITHISGVSMLMVLLMTGSSAVLIEQFEEDTPALLGRLGCTLAAGGTPLVLRYLAEQRKQPGRPLFPGLKAAMAGAAPKPPQLHDEVREEMGGRGVVSVYGSTEAPFVSVSTLLDGDEQLARTEGRTHRDVDVRVAGEDGAPLPPGSVGEIRVRGPLVCKGYLDASLDADAFDAEGYFRTGDLGSVDRDGYLTITGRLKDIIIRNGENISAKEIEDVLYDHPGIAEAAVIGLPDPLRGERCCAVVVSRPGRDIDLAGIAHFCGEAGLAKQKTPEQLELVAELPRNASGKVLKHELQARFAGGRLSGAGMET